MFFYLLAVLLLIRPPSSLVLALSLLFFKLLGYVEEGMLQELHREALLWVMQSLSV